MSIYVLRYGDLLKIGYSSELATRVRNIMSSIPGDVTFVGHMPGDREVEAHLHEVFAAQRFAGEWFHESPALVAFCESLLLKELPVEPHKVRTHGVRRPKTSEELLRVKERLRTYAAHRWPELQHGDRVERLAVQLGWLPSRVADVYKASRKIALRSTESADIDRLMLDPDFDQRQGWGR